MCLCQSSLPARGVLDCGRRPFGGAGARPLGALDGVCVNALRVAATPICAVCGRSCGRVSADAGLEFGLEAKREFDLESDREADEGRSVYEPLRSAGRMLLEARAEQEAHAGASMDCTDDVSDAPRAGGRPRAFKRSTARSSCCHR
jgi:hypothetical protein